MPPSLPKIVLAPVNIAGQPISLAKALRRRGVDASLVQYAYSEAGHPFGYDADRIVMLKPNRAKVQLETIERLLDEGVGIFHFFLRTLFFSGVHQNFTGLDAPLLKQYGRRIVYRFTGEDLRHKSEHIERNPYNAYRYGYSLPIDEERQRAYHGLLREHVDAFAVADPEMQEFWPEARIIPRAADLKVLSFVGAERKARPLVVHAPSNPAVKGTRFVNEAVEKLQRDGVAFDYVEVKGMQHDEAMAVYRQADIIVDQLHIGWYGVLAVEGMALGKTVICYVRDDLFEQHEPAIPILNANPDTITDVLRLAIGDHRLREELGLKARQFAEDVHDVEKVVEQWIGLYAGVPKAELVQGPYRTLSYFGEQFIAMERLYWRSRYLSRQVEGLRAEKREADNLRSEVEHLRNEQTKSEAEE